MVKNIEEAIELAIYCHKDQKDKSGKPYILHPLHVMCKVRTEKEKIVAVLHDVVEDHYARVGEESVEKFYKSFEDQEIAEAIKALTRKDGEEYSDFIVRVSKNIIATRVKIADLEHNMDLERFDVIDKKDINRFLKYKRSKEYLQGITSYTLAFSANLNEKEKEDGNKQV